MENMERPHSHRPHYEEGLDTAGRLLNTVKRLTYVEPASNQSKVLSITELYGPFPASFNFTVERDQSNVLIVTSASMWTTAAPSYCYCIIKIDGSFATNIYTPSLYFNQNNIHLPLRLGFSLATLAWGTHTYSIEVGYGASDANDQAEVLILKLPA